VLTATRREASYLQHKIVARSRNHFRNGKAKMRSVYTVELQGTAINIKIASFAQKLLLYRIYSTYCPIRPVRLCCYMSTLSHYGLSDSAVTCPHYLTTACPTLRLHVHIISLRPVRFYSYNSTLSHYGLSGSTVTIPHYLTICTIFGKRFIEQKCVFWFPPSLSEKFLILRRIRRHDVTTAHCTLHTAHCTLHTAHSTLHTAHCTQHTAHSTLHTAHSASCTAGCNETRFFFDRFSKNPQVSNSMEIHIVGAELLNADRQTDTDK
jgi:hypothetical protein